MKGAIFKVKYILDYKHHTTSGFCFGFLPDCVLTSSCLGSSWERGRDRNESMREREEKK
jgi:hypothetical protein